MMGSMQSCIEQVRSMPSRVSSEHRSFCCRRKTLRYRSRLRGWPGLALLVMMLGPVLSYAPSAAAYELEPRSYMNLPVGMNFLGMGVIFQSGDVATDPATLLEDAEVDVFTPVLAYARAIDLWGRSAKVDVVAPYHCMEGSAYVQGMRYERDVCGLGDPAVKLSVNLIGAPATTLADLPRYRQDLIFGVGLRVGAPAGEFDSDKLLNPGANRWTIQPEAGLSKTVGRWTFESILSAKWFTDNDEFFGGVRREQEPIYALQGHLIYTFRPATWVALDANGFRGGRTEVDGRKGDDLQRNSRWGVTLALPLNRHHSLKLAASKGVVTRAGGDFEMFTVVWQYRWGAGL